jgi:Sugar phosphate isomerases/epimerases
MKRTPFRIGTTSYIIPADILPNAAYLAGKVDDVELVLFEVEEGDGNLPDESTLAQLTDIAKQNDLTYSVHLPLDLRLGDDDLSREHSTRKALQVMRVTEALNPFAYVLHLDGRSVQQEFLSPAWQAWRERTHKALSELTAFLEKPALLAVENLDHYPPDFWDEVLEGLPVCRCIDVGHLWVDGHDPLLYLEKHITAVRVIHIHGHTQRDHQSLGMVPPAELERVIGFLVESGFNGVLTMEIFGEQDFQSSCTALSAVLHKMDLEARWEKH